MAAYRYKAKDDQGKVISGIMNATSEQDLHEKLKAEGRFLIEAKEQTGKVRTKRLKPDRLADFSRNLGKLINAGITLVRALKIISEDESIKPQEREIYADVLKSVRQGMPLSDALMDQGDTFPSLFINMIRSSENAGNMDKVADQMAEYYSKEHRLNQKIKSSMTYPKILGVMIVAVVIVIMGFVLPQFEELFAQMESLPPATRLLMAMSDFVKNRWYMLIFFGVVGYMIIKLVFSIPKVKYLRDKFEVHMPVIGKLRKIVYTARFARTLSSLYSAGISILNCLTIAKSTIGNTYIESQFDDLIAAIRSGENLSTAIDRVDGFTKKLSSTVNVGEETGSLDSMLISIADQMEFESEMAVSKMVAMLEPTMIVVMAVIVGFIMIAVIQPIYGSYQTIANQSH
ncbi:MAG: type II secretion system F family protein [Lachnospiraceae bacterium]|nr:type II secretion system F family protein [Lachnospiraceae bacterium]